MWVMYKGERVLVVAPFLNYVTISINGVETKINYSQIEEYDTERERTANF